MNKEVKKCSKCGFELNTINFTAMMTEQWTLNENTWECVAHNSLIKDPTSKVFCPECDNLVGTGKDFGF